MSEWEQILNWSDTCRFRFVDIRDHGFTSYKELQCISADGVTKLEVINKRRYLLAVVKDEELELYELF